MNTNKPSTLFNTLEGLCEYYNACADWETAIGDAILQNGWNYHEESTTSLCDDGESEVRINTNGEAYVAYDALV